MDILLKNGIVISNDVPPGVKDVFLTDGLISEVSEKVRHEADYVIDCKGKIVTPGFVNMHTHVSMTNMRTLLDDLAFDKFLEAGFKLDSARTDEEVYYGAKLGILEMLRNGITSFMDMYYSQNATAKAVEETGIRAFLGWSIVNKNITTQKGEPLKNAENFIRDYIDHKLVTPLPAPHGIYSCERDDLIAAKEIADRYELPYTIHLSENRREVYDIVRKEKKRPVEYLNDLGFLSNKMVASHLIYVTLSEMRLLGRNGVTAVNDPISNMKLGNGNFSPIIEMVENGVNYTIGTDSASTENSLDLLENAKIASLLQKNYREEPSALDPGMMVKALTYNPWKVLGKKGGMIKEGYVADITVIGGGLPQVPLIPENSENILIYSSRGGDVSHTIVDGKLLYSEGNYPNIDVEHVVKKNKEIFEHYRSIMNS